MERALDRIAELHEGDREPDPWCCDECGKPWPCPTRRLCDEAAASPEYLHARCDDAIASAERPTVMLVDALGAAVAERDAARADAERLAAAIRGASVRTMRQEDALAAHDALTAEAGTWVTRGTGSHGDQKYRIQDFKA